MDPSVSVDCKQLLPVEMWELVFDQLGSIDDLVNCYSTCTTWKRILFQQVGPTVALHAIIPILWKTLNWRSHEDYQALLHCRLVCHRWKRIIDDGTFIQEDWDWEINSECHLVDYFGSLGHTLQGSKVRRAGAYNYFQMLEPQTHNPFPSRTLQFEFKQALPYMSEVERKETKRSQELLFPTISHRHGAHVDNLICRIEHGAIASILSPLFTDFPSLRRLKLIFFMGRNYCYHSTKVLLVEAEREILEELVHESGGIMKRSGGVHGGLSHLTELTIFNLGRAMPFPAVLAALVVRSPALRKVTLVWIYEEEDLDSSDQEHNCNVATVLAAIGRSASAVSQLVLIGSDKHLDLKEWLPKEEPHCHWAALKSLTVRLTATGDRRVGPAVVPVFLLALKRFSRSLEELKIQAPASVVCRGKGLFRKEEEEFWNFAARHHRRNCWDSIRESINKESLKFRLAVGVKRFEKLKILATHSSLLLPPLFQVVMKACPKLEQLWIYHNVEDQFWRGNGRNGADGTRRSERGLEELVCQLWTRSPPTLCLILVQKATVGVVEGRNYKFWRRKKLKKGKQETGGSKSKTQDYLP